MPASPGIRADAAGEAREHPHAGRAARAGDGADFGFAAAVEVPCRDAGQVRVVRVVFGMPEGAVSASTVCDRLPTSAWRRMFNPSAQAAFNPYSMPLRTILTEWPAPLGPQRR
jgi:hypothetical protein